MENCIFCKIGTGEISSYDVWQDQRYKAFLDINPINPGHILIIPKKHASDIFDLDESEYQDLLSIAKKIAPILKEKFSAPRIGLVIEGFGVDHVHVHLVPIYKGNELNPERATPANKEDLIALQKILKEALR